MIIYILSLILGYDGSLSCTNLASIKGKNNDYSMSSSVYIVVYIVPVRASSNFSSFSFASMRRAITFT